MIVSDLRNSVLKAKPVLAKEAMSVWGFLNFIAAVIKQAQPFARELGRCIVEAKVFQAWCSGHKRFNPPIKVSALAMEDLQWWLYLFEAKPHRTVRPCCVFLYATRLVDYILVGTLRHIYTHPTTVVLSGKYQPGLRIHHRLHRMKV